MRPDRLFDRTYFTVIGEKSWNQFWACTKPVTSLREKLIKIGAKVVRHARYAVFQMAEVAVPNELFEKILRLLDGLRRRAAPT